MAGARTQGVGRGVNWGAFGAMGQQYAEIGRTVERGSSALGEGLGRGLSAIGGAIERKKVRQQQAAERQQERDYRAGRDAVQDARYEESNREQNALFEHQLFQEQMQSQYIQGIGQKAEMEARQGRVRNLAALLDSSAKMYNQTEDPVYQGQMVRAYEALQAELSGMGAGQAQAAPGAAPTPMASPSVPGTGPVMERPDAPPVNDVAMARDFFRKNGIEDRTIASPGLSGFSLRTPLGSIEGRLISRVRMAKDAQALEAAARMVNAMDDRTPIQRAAKSRARTLVTTANTDLAGRAEVLRIREEQQRGMAVKQREDEERRQQQAKIDTKKSEDAAEKQQREAARLAAREERIRVYRSLAGDAADPSIEAAVASEESGITPAKGYEMTMERRKEAEKAGKAPVAEAPKPISRADMESVAAALVRAGRVTHMAPSAASDSLEGREAKEAIWAKGDRAIAALIASGEWGNLRPQAVSALLERSGGDKKKAAAMVWAESADKTPKKWAEIKKHLGIQ